MAMRPALDDPFLLLSRAGYPDGDAGSEAEPRMPIVIESPEPLTSENMPAVSGDPAPEMRRVGVPVAGAADPALVAPPKPYRRLVQITAPGNPANFEFSYDRLFRDPNVITVATNLVPIPIYPDQALFVRVAAGGQAGILSVIIEPRGAGR